MVIKTLDFCYVITLLATTFSFFKKCDLLLNLLNCQEWSNTQFYQVFIELYYWENESAAEE